MTPISHASKFRVQSLKLAVLVIFTFVNAGCGDETPAPAITSTLAPTPTVTVSPTFAPSPTPEVHLPDFNLCWVAYSPTQYDPNVGKIPLKSDLRDDLLVLHNAGFQGVITYGATGVLDKIPEVAKEVGFEQVIMGVWTPLDAKELKSAIDVASLVDGYIIGNEGLGDERYNFDELRKAIDEVRSATNKPVTTSERLEEYYSIDELVTLGDWLSPVVHPYWFNVKEADRATEWTIEQFVDFRNEAGQDRLIQFKEVGLPTEGDPAVNENAQAEYYQALQNSDVVFVYFEAFDQFWKSSSAESAVGPHWGLFRSDRTPKLAAGYVCGRIPPTPLPTPTIEITPTLPSTPTQIPTLTLSPTIEVSPTISPATPTEVPTPTPSQANVITIYDGKLNSGYELNIDNESHTHGWLNTVDGSLQADFLADEAWAVLYITVGKPKPIKARDQFMDLSSCHTLTVDLRSAQENTQVKIGIKDIEDPDDGSEALITENLSTEWQSYSIPLTQFTTADLHQIYLPFEVVYNGSDAITVFIDHVRFLCQ